MYPPRHLLRIPSKETTPSRARAPVVQPAPERGCTVKVTVTYRTLSDGSRVWAVCITDDDNQCASIECLSEKHANYAFIAISEALEAANRKAIVETALAPSCGLDMPRLMRLSK